MTTATAILQQTGPLETPAASETAARAPGPSWAEAFLRRDPSDALQGTTTRAALGMGLASLYGLAMGVGLGAVSMAEHVLALEMTIGSVVVMAVPALHVLLTLLDAPIDPARMAAHCSHALFRSGLLLAGLAPPLALYSTTEPEIGALLGVAGLYLAGCAGLSSLVRNVARSAYTGNARNAARTWLSLLGFTLFSMALVVRMTSTFPQFGGGL